MNFELFILPIIALITGIFVKITDVVIDDKKVIIFKNSDVIFGIFYGFLIGYLISRYPIIAPLWVGVVIGVLVTKKIDGLGHILAMPMIILTVFFLGFQSFSLILTIIFAISCLIEEIVNNYVDKHKENIYIKIIKLRPIVEIIALVVSIILKRYEIFLSIFMLDVGYVSTTKFFNKS